MSIQDSSKQKIIFVLGTGRSGTHLVGYLLRNHPDINISIEKQQIFDLSIKIALRQQNKEIFLPKLLKLYENELKKSAPKHYADKSHTNIWIAEDLAKKFSNAIFIGIQRNPYATVASMLNHKGVLTWYRNWKQLPIPNQFLGITNTNVKEFEKMSLAKKCALRWVSHKEKMEELKKKLGNRIYVISYEELLKNPENESAKIQEFLKLTSPFPLPKIRQESLDKWKKNLSQEQIQDILNIVGKRPEHFN
jgi:hypothetical protein